jgi:hypothetical protein
LLAAEALAPKITAEAKARQAASGGKGRIASGKLPQAIKGRARDKAEAKARQREHGGTAPGKHSRQIAGSDKGEARDKAKARQATAGPLTGRGAKPNGSGKLPEAVKGQARDKAAAFTGIGRTISFAAAAKGGLLQAICLKQSRAMPAPCCALRRWIIGISVLV